MYLEVQEKYLSGNDQEPAMKFSLRNVDLTKY